ncbi:MAG: cytochrome b N-terminal domain-containing protein [bacterium]|jgi:cytochrome b6
MSASPQSKSERPWSWRVGDWFEERFEWREWWRAQANQIVPLHATNWMYCLGGLTFLMFGIQLVSGILLLLYYKPTVSEAYNSVRFIATEVSFGWFVRSVHHWCANLFIVFLFLHMARVFFTGSYKAPREMTWVSGVVLLLIGLLFGFTGYLLPWDQIAYWATTVGTDLAKAVPPPALGNLLIVLLRGGATVSGDTLTRFFMLHVVFLPLGTLVFMLGHFLMIRRQGISGPL